jgi:hypothetical protein
LLILRSDAANEVANGDKLTNLDGVVAMVYEDVVFARDDNGKALPIVLDTCFVRH